jgi:hypothetical protein
LERPYDRHIRNDELNALVPSLSETGHESPRLSPDVVREAELHVLACADCEAKVRKYKQLVNGASHAPVLEAAPPGDDCPKDNDVEWYEVAAGLWPELKVRQLILHAALCDHCGPLLRAATSVNHDLTPQEERVLAGAKASSRPDPSHLSVWLSPRLWQLMRWLVPAAAFMVIAGVLARIPSSPKMPLSGPKFAEFAVSAHRQHAQGSLALDVHTNSQQTLNEWFRTESQFPLALPASPAVPGEERPYRLEGARLVQVGGKNAAYIAYKMQPGAASLVVTPDSVAVASGGVEVDFTKVSFHYSMVEGYRVVTWTVHGLTYGLVSQEGNRTQQSCMVCHSPLRDRDLSQIPTPFATKRNAGDTILQ